MYLKELLSNYAVYLKEEYESDKDIMWGHTENLIQVQFLWKMKDCISMITQNREINRKKDKGGPQSESELVQNYSR